ncbi:MAG: phosphodiester glycosidase family protein [Solirubrobacterales bacterium]
MRVNLCDGRATTLHVARFPREGSRATLVSFPRPRRLVEWCMRSDTRHALVAGFFLRPEGRPLGELRLGGMARDHEPFASPWGGRRGSVALEDGAVEIAPRPELGIAPLGDLVEAGPLLVRNGESVVSGVPDPEGFSSAAHQFDSDITAGRYPRAALGITGDELLAVAGDGRAADEAGLTLPELADAMVSLGSRTAINLDGGGSTSLVFDGMLRNAPREEHGILIPGGRPIATALVFEERAAA